MRIHSAGNRCNRKIWLQFRYSIIKENKEKSLRIFERGHSFEKEILDKLKKINGIDVLDQQTEFTDGWIQGHCDAIIKYKNIKYVFECKTANQKNFLIILKNGIVNAKPEHYIQMQLYMHYAGIENGLYFVHNKNTEETYIEEVKYNKELSEAQINKLKGIVFQEFAPIKLNENNFICKMCDYNELCHKNKMANQTCRSCVNLEFKENREAYCNSKEKKISFAMQSFSQTIEKNCQKYKIIDGVQEIRSDIKKLKNDLDLAFGGTKIYEIKK